MTEVQVRRAALDDVDDLVALIESAYRGEGSRVGWTTEADLLLGTRTNAAAVREVLSGESSLMLVADGAEGLVGCCQLEHRGETAYFGMFAVRPGLQGQGVGRTIMARAEETAVARWGVTAMEMTVLRQRDELIAWYVRRGYRRTGELSPFPYGQDEFGIPQRDDLVFEKLVKELGSPR